MAIISKCTASIIKDAALALKEGHLVAFPTETVYGLGADATNEKAVARIYEVKGRPKDHPLIVHISSVELLHKWVSEIPELAFKLAKQFWPGPMTLVLPRSKIAKDFITGGQDKVAIRVPAHPVANQILVEFQNLGGYGIAAPSANRYGKLTPNSADSVVTEIGNLLTDKDLILDGGHSTFGLESTIIGFEQNLPLILRPGIVTSEEIFSLIGFECKIGSFKNSSTRVPGSLKQHYSPNADIFLKGSPAPGDGLIALANVSTPDGVIRLASPLNIEDFAFILYESLREADYKQIKNVYIVLPGPEGIGKAIIDRASKML